MSVMVRLSITLMVCKDATLARYLVYTELELSSAEKWGDDSGVCSVMPASGIEMLCWLRAVAESDNIRLFPSISSCPCLSVFLSLSISPFVRLHLFTCNLHLSFLVLPVLLRSLRGYVCGLLPYPSFRPRFSLVLLSVFFLRVHAHVLHSLMDASLC